MTGARSGFIAAAAIVLALAASARALAQMGSPLSNNPAIHQGQAGVQDIQKRAETETPFRIIKDVKKALEDADPNVRVQGLKKLRFLQDPQVTGLLMRGMVDSDVRVKIKAIDILGERETDDAVPELSQLLFLRSTEPVVKLHLAAALGRIGDARGTLPAIQYLEEQSDERSRGTAVFALGEIGDNRATEILTKVATEDQSEMVRRLAQEALQKIDGELPTQHSARLAQKQDKQLEPTDQRLSKMREMDEKMQELQH
ncbi:MAG: HEAT repeat domain-containing protein [Candidatus Binataceae bacterium]